MFLQNVFLFVNTLMIAYDVDKLLGKYMKREMWLC